MIKKLKGGGMVVIDKSRKALYRTTISCMEHFNTIALTGFALVFLLIMIFLWDYLLIMWLISLDYNFYKHII